MADEDPTEPSEQRKKRIEFEGMKDFANHRQYTTDVRMSPGANQYIKNIETRERQREPTAIESIEYSPTAESQRTRVLEPEYELRPAKPSEYYQEELPEIGERATLIKGISKAERIDSGYAGDVAGKTYGAVGAGAGKIAGVVGEHLQKGELSGYVQRKVKERLPWTTESRMRELRKETAENKAWGRKLQMADANLQYWHDYGAASKYSADTLNALQSARQTSIGAQTSLQKEQQRVAMLQDARQKLFSTPTAGVSIPSRGSYFDQLSVGFTQPQQYQQPMRNTSMDNAMNQAMMYSMLGMGSGGSSQNNATLNSMLGLGSAPQAQQNNTRSLYAMLGMSSPAPAKVYAAQPRRAFKRPYAKPYALPATPPFKRFKKRTTSYSNYKKPYARPEAPAKRPFKQYKSYKPQSTTYSKFSKFKKPWQGKATSQKKSWYADKASWERKATYKPAWKSKPKFGSWKKKTAWKGKTFKKKTWSNWKRR